jgi:hypothetical protein
MGQLQLAGFQVGCTGYAVPVCFDPGQQTSLADDEPQGGKRLFGRRFEVGFEGHGKFEFGDLGIQGFSN